MSEAALALDGVSRGFSQGGGARLEVLRAVSLGVKSGEIVALVGPSGSGKSTLLHIAGLLERPDDGEVSLNGAGCAALRDGDRTAIRRTQLGFVYQFHHLLPEFSALENVILPQMIAGDPIQHAWMGISAAGDVTGTPTVGSVVAGGPADQAGLRSGDHLAREPDRLLGEAKEEAARTLAAARAEVAEMRAKAEADIKGYKAAALDALKMAARDTGLELRSGHGSGPPARCGGKRGAAASAAAMKSSSAPSSTACGLLFSTPVRRSLTIW